MTTDDHQIAPSEQDEEHDEDFSYLTADLDPADLASLFRAAAELQRAVASTIAPDDSLELGFALDALGITAGVVQLVGEPDEGFSLGVFERIEDRERVAVGEAFRRGERMELPPHHVLELEPASTVSPRLIAAIAEHGWELASPDAIPMLYSIGAGAIRPPTPRELHIVEALSRALTLVLRGAGDELEAMGESSAARRCTVPTAAGNLEVELRMDDVPAARADEEGDDDSLLLAFARSPEAKSLEAWGYLPLLQDLALTHVGVGLDAVDTSELRELLFERVPRELGIEPTSARPLIAELRAFYAYLARTRGAALPAARELSDDAVPRLEAALTNTAGYERLERSILRPAPQRAPASKAAKAKRKAARKARKKNR